MVIKIHDDRMHFVSRQTRQRRRLPPLSIRLPGSLNSHCPDHQVLDYPEYIQIMGPLSQHRVLSCHLMVNCGPPFYHQIILCSRDEQLLLHIRRKHFPAVTGHTRKARRCTPSLRVSNMLRAQFRRCIPHSIKQSTLSRHSSAGPLPPNITL